MEYDKILNNFLYTLYERYISKSLSLNYDLINTVK